MEGYAWFAVARANGQEQSKPALSKTAKYGTAHDLRRGFGFRWSRKVMPAVLKELMRHADIKTTMDFYVGTEAEETARMLYRLAQVADLVESDANSAEARKVSRTQL